MDLLVGPLLADLRISARTLSREVADLTAAHAVARDRADSLERQLTEECALRTAEAAESSRASADFERQLAELAHQVASANSELERLANDRDQKAREIAELSQRLFAANAEQVRATADSEQKGREIAEISEQLSAANAEEDRLTAEREQKSREIAELSARLSEAQGERDSIALKVEEKTREAAQAGRRLAVMKALFAQKRAELVAARETIGAVKTEIVLVREESNRELDLVKQTAEATLKQAEIAARSKEGKLAQRYQEIATLTNQLRGQEQRCERADDNVSWLLALNQRLAEQPRWWGLMPASWLRQRRLQYLQDVGLFDGSAYLRRYPDVSAAGKDPLDHYLEHGFKEGRLRNSEFSDESS